MSWYRIKKIDGEPYKYEITNYRDEQTGEPKQHSKYIGPVKDNKNNNEPDHKAKHQDKSNKG